MAQLVYIKRIRPDTFLHFSSRGESFCLRDYSRSPHGGPYEVMRQGRGITASRIKDEALEPGNWLVSAPAVDLNDCEFWHNHIIDLNSEYLGATASPAVSQASLATPIRETSQPAANATVGTTPRGAVGAILDALRHEKASTETDPWLREAVPLVERSINRLVEEFVAYPYLHRVEHSIHAQLFHIMLSFDQLAQRVPIGDGRAVTQLIHKEWPETSPRERARRGNFDLAILSPSQLRTCASLDAFQSGRLPAPIVIEIGLDYGAEHLAGDAQKLLNSKPTYGYLVHLVRESPRDPQAEQIILGMQSQFDGIKTAYAWVAGHRCALKLTSDPGIKER